MKRSAMYKNIRRQKLLSRGETGRWNKEEEQVKSNDDSLYIKRLESADALNALLTHHLYVQFESWRRFAS